MAITIAVGLYPEASKITLAYHALVERLLARGKVTKTTFVCEDALGREKTERTDSVRHDLEQLTSSLLQSRNLLLIDVPYQLHSGRYVPITLYFYGNDFHDGWPARYDGNLHICMSLNDLVRPMRRIVDAGRTVPEPELNALETAVTADAEELFLRCCGRAEDEQYDDSILHAAMYWATGWGSPLGCSMAFHQQTREFAQDFGRIYAQYHWGGTMPVLYQNEVDLWDKQTRMLMGFMPAVKDRPELYKHLWSGEMEEIRGFLESLDPERVRALSSLPDHFVRDRLTEVEMAVRDIRCHDFGDGGFALTTSPVLSLWRAYEFIARSLEDK